MIKNQWPIYIDSQWVKQNCNTMFIHIIRKTEADKIRVAQAFLTKETVLKIPFVF